MLIVSESLWLAQTNCYLLATGEGATAVAVDAPPDPAVIARLAAGHGLTIVALLLTHGHIDHAGGPEQSTAPPEQASMCTVTTTT